MDINSEDNAPSLSREEIELWLKNNGSHDSIPRVMLLQLLYDIYAIYDRARKSIITSCSLEANKKPGQSLSAKELYVAIRSFHFSGDFLHKVIMDINPKGTFYDDIQTSLKDGPYSKFVKILQDKDFDLSDASYTILGYLLRTMCKELAHNIIPEQMVDCLIGINVLSDEDVTIIKKLNSEGKSDLLHEHTSGAVLGVIAKLTSFLTILNSQGNEEEDFLSDQNNNTLLSNEQIESLRNFAQYGSKPSVVNNLYYVIRKAIQQKEAEVFGAERQNTTQNTKVAAKKDKRFDPEKCRLFDGSAYGDIEKNKSILKKLYMMLTGEITYKSKPIVYIDKNKCSVQDFYFMFGLSDEPEHEDCCIDWIVDTLVSFKALIYSLFEEGTRFPDNSKYYIWHNKTVKFSVNSDEVKNNPKKVFWEDIISYCQQEDEEKGDGA